MSDIKFVYFDIGNVLLGFGSQSEETGERFNIEPAKILETITRIMGPALRGDITPHELSNQLAEELGINPDKFDFADIAKRSLTPIPETQQFVEDLSKKMPVGVLSDMWYGQFEYVMRQALLPRVFFSAIIISCEVGAIKPEPKIFQIAEETSGYEPKEILFTDDRKDVIEAAEKRGWNTILFNPNDVTRSIAEIKTRLDL